MCERSTNDTKTHVLSSQDGREESRSRRRSTWFLLTWATPYNFFWKCFGSQRSLCNAVSLAVWPWSKSMFFRLLCVLFYFIYLFCYFSTRILYLKWKSLAKQCNRMLWFIPYPTGSFVFDVINVNVRIISDACTQIWWVEFLFKLLPQKKTPNIPLSRCSVHELMKGCEKRQHTLRTHTSSPHLLGFTYQSFDMCPSGLSLTCTVCFAVSYPGIQSFPSAVVKPLSKAFAIVRFIQRLNTRSTTADQCLGFICLLLVSFFFGPRVVGL